MTPIAAADSASAITPAVAPAKSENTTADALASDFETFLNLLTAQLENQDPLKPLESTEFVAQLAQFSAVEQQVRSNDTLGRIEAALTGGSGLTEWLGVEVESASALAFKGGPVSLRYDANSTAATATLLVQSETGAIVARQAVPPGEGSVSWNGLTSSGETAPDGVYSFTIEQTDTAGEVETLPALGFAKVNESRISANGGIELVLESGDVIAAASVSAARTQ